MKNLDAFDNTLQSVRGNFKMSIYMQEKPAHIHVAFFVAKIFLDPFQEKQLKRQSQPRHFYEV